jgi:hypothetical protein
MEAAYLAHEVVTQQPDHQPADLQKMILSAQGDVDHEIEQAFDPGTAKKVKLMVMASEYLNRVNQSISRAMVEAGEPLAPEQVLPLAVILLETYGTGDNPEARVTAEKLDPQTGLMPIDEIAVQRAAALLSERQLTALRRLVAEQNRAQEIVNRS